MSVLIGQAVSSRRVPVSTAGVCSGQTETGVPRLDHLPVQHQKLLVGRLVHMYGWVLGQDGNLYAPDSSFAWGERVA